MIDQKIIGFEALIRWNNPEHGLIMPSEFIFIAEETNLILDIGIWVIKEACCRIKSLCEMGVDNFTVAINLSSSQFDKKLITSIKKVLNEINLSPKYLELEITEITLLHASETAIEILNSLRAMGITISIDDFGTGYSSLSYLKHLPIDSIKIDRSFIMNLPDNIQDIAIVKAIISLAHSLSLKVVAEGVENKEQYNYLNALTCDEMQGYYLSRPIPFDNLKNLIMNSDKGSLI